MSLSLRRDRVSSESYLIQFQNSQQDPWDDFQEYKLGQLIKSVIEIHQSIGWNESDRAYAEYNLSDPLCPRVLVEISNETSVKVIGYALLSKKNSFSWCLGQIAIHQDHQGRNLGKRVINEIFKQALLQGISTIFLHVDRRIPRLVSFYHSFSDQMDFSLEEEGESLSLITYTFKRGSFNELLVRVISIWEGSRFMQQSNPAGHWLDAVAW